MHHLATDISFLQYTLWHVKLHLCCQAR